MRGAAAALAGLLAIAGASSGRAAETDCLETEAALAYWRPIRAQAESSPLPADALALELVPCLGSPDPELRDGIGYELFSHWLRQGALTDETRMALLNALLARLEDGSPETALSRSFSALILAELMRSDAMGAFLSGPQRQDLLDAAAAALRAESDFRGLDEQVGWVHPVAHMADLLWRFALHPETSPAQAEQILAAVRTKVAPTSVAYSFNEGDRLARVVATLVRRRLAPDGAVEGWLRGFEAPQSMSAWSNAFQSAEGMAELHNTKQFLRALSDQLAGEEVDPGVARVLDELVSGFTALV